MLPTTEVLLLGVGFVFFFKSLVIFVSKEKTLGVIAGSGPGFTLLLCHLHRLSFQVCGQIVWRLAGIPSCVIPCLLCAWLELVTCY